MGVCINRYRHTFVPGNGVTYEKAKVLEPLLNGHSSDYEVFPIVDGKIQWPVPSSYVAHLVKSFYGVTELPELGHGVTGFIIRECIQSQACAWGEDDEYAQACRDSLKDWEMYIKER